MSNNQPALRPVRSRASHSGGGSTESAGRFFLIMTDDPKAIRESLHMLAYRAQFGVEEEEAKPVLNRAKKAARFFHNEIDRKLEEIKILHSQHSRLERLIAAAEEKMMEHFAAKYEQARKTANLAIAKGELRRYIFTRDGGKCRVCQSTKKLSIDHIVPVIAGGGNELENLQTLCGPCNSSKGGRSQ